MNEVFSFEDVALIKCSHEWIYTIRDWDASILAGLSLNTAHHVSLFEMDVLDWHLHKFNRAHTSIYVYQHDADYIIVAVRPKGLQLLRRKRPMHFGLAEEWQLNELGVVLEYEVVRVCKRKYCVECHFDLLLAGH